MFSIKRVSTIAAMVCVSTGCSEKVNFTSTALGVQKASNCEVEGTCPPNIRTINESYKVPNGAGKVDIMFVFDTTPPMFKTITEFHTRMKNLTSMLPDYIDWQVGIANASLGKFDLALGWYKAGELEELAVFPKTEVSGPPSVLTANTPSADELFIGNTSFLMRTWGQPDQDFCSAQPYCTKGAAEPMRSIQTAINNRSNYMNSTFFRSGAIFAPVIVSATDENLGKPQVSSADVINTYNSTLGSKMAGMKAYSLNIPSGDKACLDRYSSIFKEGDGGMYGSNLENFAAATGGKSFSICGSDYSKVLSQVIAGLQPQIKTIQLQYPPMPGSLKIVAVPSASLSFTVSDATVTFDQALPAGSTLSISYQVQVE